MTFNKGLQCRSYLLVQPRNDSTGSAGEPNVVPFVLIVWGQHHIASGLTSILNATTGVSKTWGSLLACFGLIGLAEA